MKQVCAWCGRSLGQRNPLDNPQVTHGICRECNEWLEARADEKQPAATDDLQKNEPPKYQLNWSSE